MGIVGSGTNNARLANMLRQLAQYYHKDANNLFMVCRWSVLRMAQWAKKGGHDSLGVVGPLDLITEVFLRVVWPKNDIKMVCKTLKHQENIFLAYFWLSRQPKFSSQS